MSPRSKQQFEEVRASTKTLITDTALTLFSKKGYFNTSVRDIAKSANISVGLLYNYYPSKESLALGVLSSAFKAIDHAIDQQNQLEPADQMATAIQNFIQLIQNEHDKIRLLAQMGIHREKFDFLNDITIKKYKDSVNKFETSLRNLGVENSKVEAQFLVATLDGLVFESLLMDGAINLNEMQTELIKKYCK